MKKIGLLLLSLLGIGNFLYSQQNWCGTDAHLHKTITPGSPEATAFVNHYLNLNNQVNDRADRSDTIIIPVVVHVIHDNGIGNISYEQIQSGIDMLNVDFNRLNADTINTRNTVDAPFEPIAVSMNISFELAKIDPNGNCTNGVERKNSPIATYNAGENAKYDADGGLDAWPRDKYLNIWIVNSIENDGTAGVTLGYAQFPQFANDGYGVIIRHDSYGDVGTASGDRTLTHEVGHCLGLLHTFQGPFFGSGTGCHTADCASNGDFCCDTPPATAAHWDCPPTYNSCTSIPTNDYYGIDAHDQWENFMSYAPCQNMYTQGQFDIVHNNLTSIGFLTNLVSLANQAAAGVNQPTVLCMASFFSETQLICAGNSIQFYDESFFNVTGWTWTFEGAAVVNSNDQNPLVTYNSAGTFDVTLEVTDGVSTETLILNDYIKVMENPGHSMPYKEGFESLVNLEDDNRFFTINSNSGNTWEITSTTSYTGNDCVFLENHGNTDGSKDELVSGSYDLSNVSTSDPIVFNFMYAYKRKTSGDAESLKFYVSKDCGETWSLRKNLQGTDFGTGNQTGYYTPSADADWKQVSITNITSDYYVSDFRFKFVFENDGGNNIYIDNINMYPESMTEINELNNIDNISLFPNPTENILNLQFDVLETDLFEITVYNALGEIVQNLRYDNLNQGENLISISTENYLSGIYFLEVKSSTSIQTINFIKK